MKRISIYELFKRKKQPHDSCGALLGLFGTVGYAMGGLGIFQLPSFIQPKEGINVSFIGHFNE